MIQALGLQYQLERLVPGYVLQTQRDAPGNRVASDEVEIREIGNKLQHRTHFDVLEVERKLLATVLEDVVTTIDFFCCQRIDVDRQRVVGLVRQIVVVAAGGDGEHHVIADLQRIDNLYRGGEICHVQPSLQIFR